MEWPSGEPSNWIAGALAGMATFFVGLWKGRLKMRSDLRDDRGQEAEARARHDVLETLRGEVTRLSATVAAMSVEIGRERAARREAEERAINAERQVAVLTERVGVLEMSIQTTR